MGKVVPLFRRKAFDMPSDLAQLTPEWLDDFIGILWHSVKEVGKSWEQIALESGVTLPTILRLLYRETKDPRLSTILKLHRAMFLRLGEFRQDAPLQADEINPKPYRSEIVRRRPKQRRQPSWYAERDQRTTRA